MNPPTPSGAMPLPRRAALTLFAVVTLAFAIAPSGGMYSHFGVVGVLVALGLAVAACTRADGPWNVAPDFGDKLVRAALFLLAVQAGLKGLRQRDVLDGTLAVAAGGLLVLERGRFLRPPADPFLKCLSAAVVMLAGFGLLGAEVLYGAVWQERTPLLAAAGSAGFLVAASWLFGAEGGDHKGTNIRLVLAFAAGALLRAGGLLGSEPIVDVEVALREAPRHLLEGRNPYTADYPDPYVTDRARAFGLGTPPHSATYPFYPPLPFLVALPFRAAGLDSRWANVVCDLLAALALYAAGARHDPRRAGLLTTAYLLLPRAPFLIEHGWYEPMLAAGLGGGLLLAERGQRGGAVLVGLGLTAKQFGLPLLFPLAKALWRSRRGLAAGLALGAALAAPFLVWDAGAFLEAVLFSHLRRPAMYDSLTLSSAAYHLLGVTPPRALLLAGAAGLIAWITWKTPEAGAGAATWAGAALFAFCVLHTQGYFNYFYLVIYMLLLGVAASPARVELIHAGEENGSAWGTSRVGGEEG